MSAVLEKDVPFQIKDKIKVRVRHTNFEKKILNIFLVTIS
tara:strand:- start:2187 stop:2306 length:120 start_codon:yes stop_codon:yes gene_type:complete